MKEKKCEICGKEYIIKSKNHKYPTCSESCRKKYTWKNKIEERRNNAEKRYIENIEEERKKRKDYGRSHSKEAVERMNKWAKENPEKIKRNKNKWRKENYEKNKFKDEARRKGRNSITLNNKHCIICGSTKYLQRHHQDYTKPYDVIIVCAKCHTNIHREERYGF